jgi:DNA-binding GntR family transcriptional regulator
MNSPMLVDRSAKTLRELTLDKLREAIASQRYRPGDRLVERDLCEQLGVSRTVVREALRYLEAEGLVQSQGQRGPVVARPTISETRQIYEIRGALESLAARACAERRDPAIADELDAILTRMRRGYKKGSSSDVLTEAANFYRALFQGADKAVAWTIISSLHSRINHLRALTIKTPGRSRSGPVQMQAIVDAIRKGDADGAAKACLTHVEAASALADTLIREMERTDRLAVSAVG